MHTGPGRGPTTRPTPSWHATHVTRVLLLAIIVIMDPRLAGPWSAGHSVLYAGLSERDVHSRQCNGMRGRPAAAELGVVCGPHQLHTPARQLLKQARAAELQDTHKDTYVHVKPLDVQWFRGAHTRGWS